MTLRCTEILIAEHRGVEKNFAELEALIDEFLTTTEVTAESLRALERIVEFLGRDLVLHIRKEDEGLFPALQRFLPAHAGPIAVMLEEHALITQSFRGLLEGLEQLKCNPKTETFGAGEVRDNGRALIQVLRAHLFKEEQVLFPFAESRLNAEDDRQILLRFEEIATRFSRSVPAQSHA